MRFSTLKRPILLAFCLFAVCFSLFKSLAFADDTLAALKTESAAARQKERQISATVSSARLSLDEAKMSLLQREAEDLMRDLAARNVSGSQNGLETAPAPLARRYEKPQADVKLPAPVPAASKNDRPVLPWMELWNSVEAFKNKHLTEGDSLYKVAISDGRISLEEARAIGLANNRGLQGMKKKIEVAQSKLTEAKRALYPSVQVSAEWNEGLASTQPSDATHGRYFIGKNQKLSVSQPLFYGGELHYKVKQAEESLKSAKADYEKQKGEFLLQIETAYYGLLKAEYNVQYQFELYDRANTLRRRVAGEHAAKLISEVDYLNFDSKYQEAYFQVESSKNDYESAVLVLHQAMYLDPKWPTPVDLRLRFVKTNPDYDELLKIALQNNPELRMKEFGVVAAEYALKVFRAKKLPRWDVKASYGYLGEIFRDTDALINGNADLDTEREWFVGFQGSMPVGPNSVSYSHTKNVFGPTVLALTGSEAQRHHVEFNFFDKLADITDEKSAEATYLEALADLDKSRNDVALKLRDDFYNMQKSLIQIDSSIAKLRYQGKQNQIQEYLLGLQETNAATYVEGLQEEAQNKFSFIQAVADYNLALTDIGLTIGDPYYLARKPKA